MSGKQIIPELAYKPIPADEAIYYTGYDLVDVKPHEVISPSKYSYREACLMNGWDPDLPPKIVFHKDELA